MLLQENISLKPYNTFGIDVKARYFATFNDTDELAETLNLKSQTSNLILGGGSNILLTKDYDGLVLKNEIRGIVELHEDSEYVYVKAGAGENWHQFVLYCIERNWAGVENLSLIPGNVGASPMQNIGAYGVEIDDVFWDLEAFHKKDKKVVTFTRSDCEFGYRESVFKEKFKDQFVILNVTFQLRKKPRFNTSYGAIEQELQRMGVRELSLKAISAAVINIRNSKLPNPGEIGNAGSFFKNPSVTNEQFVSLKARFENMAGHENIDGTVKLAAGWLIEQCGWKGYRKGDAGCHAKQALVLVNYGNATGTEIYNLSEEIIQSVKEKFGITLEREVNII
ncbi:MAG TPA: UDP-N-acetylmuramate dehydrogenase [Chitinophagaceae bacterium]|nr:UDP-N-acetylmuramate dehydrogenase [Chitinophagaceae bacterium]HQZ75396.1 UDP-N-acetylmuramate dehydrogenase [Chitinophagaceae bacterium]